VIDGSAMVYHAVNSRGRFLAGCRFGRVRCNDLRGRRGRLAVRRDGESEIDLTAQLVGDNGCVRARITRSVSRQPSDRRRLSTIARDRWQRPDSLRDNGRRGRSRGRLRYITQSMFGKDGEQTNSRMQRPYSRCGLVHPGRLSAAGATDLRQKRMPIPSRPTTP
jgi:hypothetical protein